MEIKKQHIELAAKMFTITNLGHPEPRSFGTINEEFNQMHETLVAECGMEDGAEGEYESWLKECKHQDAYYVKQWNDFLERKGPAPMPTDGTPKYPNVKVQLSGRDGNAYGIIVAVKRAMRQAKVPKSDILEFTIQAKMGDYDHLLQTCMRWVDVE